MTLRFSFKKTCFQWLIPAALVLLLLNGCSSSDADKSSASLISEARALLDEGKPRYALIELKKVLQQDPDQHEARLLLSVIYLGQSNPANAEIEIRKAISLGLKRESWIDLLGQSLLLQSKYQKVLDEIKQVDTDKNELKSQIALLRGDAFFGLKQYNQASKLYLESRLFSAENVSPLYGLARVAIVNNERAKGMDYLDKVLAKSPDHSQSLLQKGDIYLKSGNAIKALYFYDKAAKSGQSPLALLKRSFVLINMGRTEEASKDLAQVLKNYPASPLANFLNARIHFLNNDIDRANDLLQEVFRVDSGYLPAHLLNGIVASSKGWDRQAELSLSKYLADDPDNIVVSKLLAVVQLRAGSNDSVIKRLADNRKSAKVDQETLTLLGIAYLQSKQIEKARKLLSASASIKSSLLRNEKLAESKAEKSNVKKSSARVLKKERVVYKKAYSELVEKTVSELLENEKIEAENYHLAGLLMLSVGEKNKAKEYFKQAIASKPDFIDAQTSLAALLMKEGEWSKAKPYLDSVLSVDSDNEKALVLLVQLYELQGDEGEALKWLNEGWKRNSKSLVFGVSVFKYYLKEKKAGKADQIQKKLIALHEGDFRVMRTIAILHVRNKHPEKAIQVLKQAIVKYPDNKLAWFMLANVEEISGDLKNAESRYRHILKENENNIAALVALANLQLKNKNFAEAENIAKKIAARYPQLSVGYQLQGKLALLNNNTEKALSSYNKALSLQPNAALLLAYSRLLVKNGQQDAAILKLRDWLLKYPGDHKSRLLLAGLYQQKKNNDGAITEYLYLEENKAFTVVALNNLIWVMLEVNDSRLSDYLDKLASLNSHAPEILDTLGWGFLSLGQNKRAGDYLLSAAAKLGDNPSVQYHLGVYYKKIGNSEKSHAILKKAVAQGDGFDEYAAAKALLATN